MNWHAARGIAQREDSMILKLPDIRQKDDYDCGAAAVDTVLRFLGVRSCAAVLDMANPVQGTAPDTVEALLRRAGLPVLSGTLHIEDLKHFPDHGRPVVCPVSTDDGGHWVIVAGISRGRVHYQCPLNGKTTMKVSDWLVRWRDTSRSGHEYDRWGIVVG